MSEVLVILESPFAGDIEKNLKYARKCMRDCFMRGELPFASHLLYTQDGILNDDLPKERMLGIDAGLCWGKFALLVLLMRVPAQLVLQLVVEAEEAVVEAEEPLRL